MTQSITQSTLPVLSFAAHPKANEVAVDLRLVMLQKLLFLGISGSGKTYAMRGAIEGVIDRAQILFFDQEGDWKSFRERYPVVIIGGFDGDFPFDAVPIKQLCHAIMQLKVNVVFDFSDSEYDFRREFTRDFLDAALLLPRDPTRQVISVFDELQILAPQGEKSVATRALKGYFTRGRSRGFSAYCGTQRMSNNDLSVLGMIANTLVGLTTLDRDIERVSGRVGLNKADVERLQHLEAGEFFVQGPAISRTAQLVRTGPALTTHYEPGKVGQYVPPAPESMRELVTQLRDLAAEIEPLTDEATSRETTSRKGAGESQNEEVRALTARNQQLSSQLKEANAELDALKALKPKEVVKYALPPSLVTLLTETGEYLIERSDSIAEHSEALESNGRLVRRKGENLLAFLKAAPTAPPDGEPSTTKKKDSLSGDKARPPRQGKIPDLRTLIVTALAHRPEGVTVHQLQLLTAYAAKSDPAWHADLRDAQRTGYVTFTDALYRATDKARAEFGQGSDVPLGAELVNQWAECLGTAPGAALRVLAGHSGRFFKQGELAQSAGYTYDGRWSKALVELRKRAYLVQQQGKDLAADKTFVELVKVK